MLFRSSGEPGIPVIAHPAAPPGSSRALNPVANHWDRTCVGLFNGRRGACHRWCVVAAFTPSAHVLARLTRLAHAAQQAKIVRTGSLPTSTHHTGRSLCAYHTAGSVLGSIGMVGVVADTPCVPGNRWVLPCLALTEGILLLVSLFAVWSLLAAPLFCPHETSSRREQLTLVDMWMPGRYVVPEYHSGY